MNDGEMTVCFVFKSQMMMNNHFDIDNIYSDYFE